MREPFLLTWALVCLSGCAASNSYTPAEASSDNIVTVSQVYMGTALRELDSEQANRQALQKCQARSYAGAKKIGSELQACSRYTGWYECFYHSVEQQYQCTADGI